MNKPAGGTLNKGLCDMKSKAHGAPQTRHIDRIAEVVSAARQSDSLVRTFNRRLPKSYRAAFVIAAGGTGTRMNAGVPKQFLEIAGKPVLLLTVEAIAGLEAVTQIVIALPPEHIARAESVLNVRSLRIRPECVAGGPNRQASVINGCARIRSDVDVIAVHDAVRPLCPREVMEKTLAAAWEKGAAVPGLQATETIQRVSRNGRVLRTPPREELYAIQTPQAFKARLLREALDRAEAEGFLGTDESSVVRRAGHPVTVIPGSPDNIKITRPLDMEIAGLLFSRRWENETV